MNIFCKPKPVSVCNQCGVHFEPGTGYKGLCGIHGPAAAELDRKIDLVKRWAARNWEKLYEQASKEEAEMQSKYTHTSLSQSQMEQMARMQQAGASFNAGLFGSGLGL